MEFVFTGSLDEEEQKDCIKYSSGEDDKRRFATSFLMVGICAFGLLKLFVDDDPLALVVAVGITMFSHILDVFKISRAQNIEKSNIESKAIINDDGISLNRDGVNIKLDWRRHEDVIIAEKGIIFHMDRVVFFYIPNRLLKTNDDRKEFLDYLKSKHESAKSDAQKNDSTP